ncbi:MAG: hypothetical protein PHG08_00820 [Bacilli bacterium]|nr:hypothetical protein [Bacilli bacterium]
MSESLSEFVESIELDLENFKTQYKMKNMENPEQYPLSLSEDNRGLWLEFFTYYVQDGTI